MWPDPKTMCSHQEFMLLYHMVKLASRVQSRRCKYERWEEIEDLVRSGYCFPQLLPASAISLSVPPQPSFNCQTLFILATETGQVSNAYTKYPTTSLTSHLAYEQPHVAGGMI